LMYSITQTRPDMAFLLSVTSRYSYNPSSEHQALLKHRYRCYQRTKHLGLEIGNKDGILLYVRWDDETFSHKAARYENRLLISLERRQGNGLFNVQPRCSNKQQHD
ncbi:hypothetical protein M406DRAFT_261755, partial [Cryphonectria parasitica EP155]